LLIPYSLAATSSLRTVSGVKRKFCGFLFISGASSGVVFFSP